MTYTSCELAEALGICAPSDGAPKIIGDYLKSEALLPGKGPSTATSAGRSQ